MKKREEYTGGRRRRRPRAADDTLFGRGPCDVASGSEVSIEKPEKDCSIAQILCRNSHQRSTIPTGRRCRCSPGCCEQWGCE